VTTSICLYANLNESLGLTLRHGLESETARVCVCTDHGDGVTRLPFVTDGEGDDGRRVTGEIVLSTRDKRMCPGVAFLDLGIASGIKSLRGRAYGMECCRMSALVPELAKRKWHTGWRGVDELDKVLGRLE